MCRRQTNPELAGPILGHVILVVLATAAGLFVRLAPVAASGFPLNDGGLFLDMIRDLQRNNFAIPMYASYNSASIPFAYPPLAFYIGALFSRLGVSLLDLVRFLPALISTLTIPLLYLLSRRLLVSEARSLMAVFAFALLPRTFQWLIMGGGLTRSVGFVFALLTLIAVHDLYVRGSRTSLLFTILFASLTILSHPELAFFTAYSTALMFFFLSRNRAGVVHSCVAAAGILLLTSPWWVSVIRYHGIGPLLAASQTGSGTWSANALSLLVFDFTEEPFMTLLGFLGLLGAVVCVVEKRHFLVAWLVVIFLLDPRSGATYATIPLAMFVEVGICRMILPALHGLASGKSVRAGTSEVRFIDLVSTLPARNALAFLFFYALFAAWYLPYTQNSPVRVLPLAQRQAMEWVADHVPEDASFLVVSGDVFWSDTASEWFPVLAHRVSVATVQGYEWLPNRAFSEQLARYNRLQTCASQGANCLARWTALSGVAPPYVYVPKPASSESRDCCSELRVALANSVDYEKSYDGPGATIFARRNAASSVNSGESGENQ